MSFNEPCLRAPVDVKSKNYRPEVGSIPGPLAPKARTLPSHQLDPNIYIYIQYNPFIPPAPGPHQCWRYNEFGVIKGFHTFVRENGAGVAYTGA